MSERRSQTIDTGSVNTWLHHFTCNDHCHMGTYLISTHAGLTTGCLGVNDHWQQMKGIMMETAQDICGMTKGVPRHKETWWWSEELAEAVRNKKIKYGKWKKENTEEARMEYKKSRQNAKRVISSTKEKKQKEWANDLNASECQNEIFRRAKQMVKERQDITGLNCIKGASGKVIVDDKVIKDCWKEYTEKLMNEENE